MKRFVQWLLSPAVLGTIGLLTTCAYYTFTLSEPQILAQATGWSVAGVGALVSAGGLAGAAAMLFTGWASDRTRARLPFMAGSALLVLAGYALIALSGGRMTALIGYACYVAGWGSVTLSVWMACTDRVAPRDMAVATATVNTMSQIGAFAGPIGWGMLRDATGSFHAGLIGLCLIQIAALGVVAVLAKGRGRNHDARG